MMGPLGRDTGRVGMIGGGEPGDPILVGRG